MTLPSSFIGVDMPIHVSWCYSEDWRAKALLRRSALATLEAERIEQAELSIAVVDAAEMSRLHQRFLDQAGATDVLTFDLGSDLGSSGKCD